MLEETIRKLQEDNTQMRWRLEIEMQVQLQGQVERQVQEHMQQRELEANAREEAREREWQWKMNDINSMLRKFNNPRPPSSWIRYCDIIMNIWIWYSNFVWYVLNGSIRILNWMQFFLCVNGSIRIPYLFYLWVSLKLFWIQDYIN